MSLSAHSEECNKTLLLFWLFAFLIGLNKRVFLSSRPAIYILELEWHFFLWSSWYVFIFKCGASSLHVWMSLHSDCFLHPQCHCYENNLSYNLFLNALYAVRPHDNKWNVLFATHWCIAQESLVFPQTLKLQWVNRSLMIIIVYNVCHRHRVWSLSVSFPAEVWVCILKFLLLNALLHSVPVVTRETSSLLQSELSLMRWRKLNIATPH